MRESIHVNVAAREDDRRRDLEDQVILRELAWRAEHRDEIANAEFKASWLKVGRASRSLLRALVRLPLLPVFLAARFIYWLVREIRRQNENPVTTP